MMKVRRKPKKNLKHDMQTTLIGRHELELLREALEQLKNPDQRCVCFEREGGNGKWMKFRN